MSDMRYARIDGSKDIDTVLAHLPINYNAVVVFGEDGLTDHILIYGRDNHGLTLDYSQMKHDEIRDSAIVCFVGEPGIGKTQTIEQYAKAINYSVDSVIPTLADLELVTAREWKSDER